MGAKRARVADNQRSRKLKNGAENGGWWLRACLVRVRVERILYALVHEKDLCHRSLRRRMGPLENSPSGLKATG